MNINCLGSGSTGNSYIINQEGITYLLDAGVDFRKIKANINLNNLNFAYISHEHKDHSLDLENLELRGVKTYYGKLIDNFTKMPTKGLKYDEIELYAFPIEHNYKDDICKNAGLIVKTETECLLYATDFSVCKYNLKKFNFTTIMVECNFEEEKMRKAPKTYKYERQRWSHMGFDGLVTFIDKAINIEPVQNIILIHLSTEERLIDREIVMMKAKAKWRNKKIGICRQYGGIDWNGG